MTLHPSPERQTDAYQPVRVHCAFRRGDRVVVETTDGASAFGKYIAPCATGSLFAYVELDVPDEDGDHVTTVNITGLAHAPSEPLPADVAAAVTDGLLAAHAQENSLAALAATTVHPSSSTTGLAAVRRGVPTMRPSGPGVQR